MATLLSDLLKECDAAIEVVAIANSGQEGIDKIKAFQPDLVFLDIQMPDMNGFEMLTQLEEINFQTVFTTAYSQYAIQAFRFNALDYLLKPIKEDELIQAVKRFRTNSLVETQAQIKNALENVSIVNPENQKLVLHTQKGRLRIALKQIVKIEGDRNYSYLHLVDQTKELSSKTLGYFEELLAEKGFFRSHRSYVVNKIHIEGIRDQSWFILKDGSEVPISRRKKTEGKDWFHNS